MSYKVQSGGNTEYIRHSVGTREKYWMQGICSNISYCNNPDRT